MFNENVPAARAWNSLPDAIRRSPSLVTFKRSSKTNLYVQCFFINIVVITFSPRVIDTVKFVEVTFFIYDTLILTILHYIIL